MNQTFAAGGNRSTTGRTPLVLASSIQAGQTLGSTNGVEYEIAPQDEMAREFVMKTFRDQCIAAADKERNGDKDDAVEAYKDALNLNQLPSGMVAYAYSNIGRLYMELRRFKDALEYHKNHLNIAVATKDNQMKVIAFSNIGTTHYCMREYIKAREQHEFALQMASDLNDAPGQMRAFANLGNAWGADGFFREAKLYHKEQLLLARKLGDKQAEGRASFNLENDYNSLKQYEVALTYKIKKMELLGTEDDQLKLNAGLGDTKLTEEIFSGWVVKQVGKSWEGPKGKPIRARKWLVLAKGLLCYFKTVKSTEKPDRCIKVEDIVEVQVYEEPTKGWTRQMINSTFRVTTTLRCFYFTCDDEETRNDWIEVISKARTDKDKFSSFRKKKGGAGKDLDFLRKFQASQDDDGAVGAAAAPADGFNLKMVDPFQADSKRGEATNPLFRSDSVSSRSRLNTNEDFEEPGMNVTAETAFLSSFGQDAGDDYLDIEGDAVPENALRLYGSLRLEEAGEWPPNDEHLQEAGNKMILKPRTLFDAQPLTMQFTDQGVEIKTIPLSKTANARMINSHPTYTIISWCAFGNCLTFAVDDSTSDHHACKVYTYDCGSTSHAKHLEDMISGLGTDEEDDDFGGDELDPNAMMLATHGSKSSVLKSFGMSGIAETSMDGRTSFGDEGYLNVNTADVDDGEDDELGRSVELTAIVTTRSNRQVSDAQGSMILGGGKMERGLSET
jgi:tetratricopeptide (TPR) repeat protein